MSNSIFTTNRLSVRPLSLNDSDLFFAMMSNPNVMNPIPRPTMNRKESDEKLSILHKPFDIKDDIKVLAITIKGNNEFIGIAGLLKNEDNEDEIGYRLREKFWGIGYGTEITKGLIDFAFEVLKTELITADVAIENIPSVKILEKFMTRDKDFFNVEDDCWDRRYKLFKKNLD